MQILIILFFMNKGTTGFLKINAFIVMICISLIRSQLVAELSSQLPSGIHSFLVPNNSQTITISVSWQNDLRDIDFGLYNTGSNIFLTASLLSAYSTDNPQSAIYEYTGEETPELILLIYQYGAIPKGEIYHLEVIVDEVTYISDDFRLFFNHYATGMTFFEVQTTNCKLNYEIQTDIANPILTTASGYTQEGRSFQVTSSTGNIVGPIGNLKLSIVHNILTVASGSDFRQFNIKIYEQQISYQWLDSIGVCNINCGLVEFAKSSSQTDIGLCLCQQGFYYDQVNYKCVIKCGELPYSLPVSVSQGECKCVQGYKWVNYSCIIDCQSIQSSTGALMKNSLNSCECNFLYQWKQKPKKCIRNQKQYQNELLVIIYVLAGVLGLLIIIVIAFPIFKKKYNNRVVNQQPLMGREQQTKNVVANKRKMVFDIYSDQKEMQKQQQQMYHNQEKNSSNQKLGRQLLLQVDHEDLSNSNRRLQQNTRGNPQSQIISGLARQISDFQSEDSN